LKKLTGSVWFYKFETKKTEPNLNKKIEKTEPNQKKPSQTEIEKNRAKPEKIEPNWFEPVFP
jgi:hypothetical protein